MQKIFAWIKNNKLTSLLILAVLFLLLKPSVNNWRYGSAEFDSYAPMMEKYSSGTMPESGYYAPEAAPVMDVQNRKVITNSSVSMLVKDVRNTLDLIETQANVFKGYVVNTQINRPEEGAAGYITVRIPTDQLKPFLEFLRGNAIKVVYENIDGQDITDQYVNVQERLNILNKTKATYMTIMDKAVSVQDILQVQQQISSLQQQIDSLEGQVKYMEASSSTSLISVTLSTDELSLPYAPDTAWRPGLIFKQAVRSLVETFRDIGQALIWVVVYAIIWVPVIVIVLIIRRLRHKKSIQ